jgi:hypothetical protein
LSSSLNYNHWKIRWSNTGKQEEILKEKTKIAEHLETSLLTARGIADLKAVFRYAMSGTMAGTGTLGIIQLKKIHEQAKDEGVSTAIRGDLTMAVTQN